MMIGTNKNEGLLIKGFYARNLAKYDEAYDNWETVGPLATFHREKDEVTEEESKTSGVRGSVTRAGSPSCWSECTAT